MLRPFLILASSVLFAGSASAQSEQEIIGYAWTCSAKLASPHGELSGHLIVDEDGTRSSFFAQVYGADAPGDDSWGDAAALRRLGKEYQNDWEMVWREEGQEPSLAFEAGELRLEVSLPRKLPAKTMLVIERPYGARGSMVDSGRRWPGRKNGVQFSFGLSELLGFLGSEPMLRWKLYRPPLSAEWDFGLRRALADGTFHLAGPRAVAPVFAQLKAQLLAKAADYRNACARNPVYYNPASEI